MADITQHPHESVQLLLKKGMSEQELLQEMTAMGMEESHALEMIRVWKKERNARRQTNGFYMLAVGSFLCFLSCVFTMLHLAPSLTNVLLYGVTSVGVLIIFAGLVMVFE